MTLPHNQTSRHPRHWFWTVRQRTIRMLLVLTACCGAWLCQPAQAQPQPIVPRAMPPGLGTTSFETPGVTAGTPSGTHVGQKIDEPDL